MFNLPFDKTIKNMKIKATDGELGHCTDLLFDERQWTARYLVVETGSWLFGRTVLIPIVSVDRIDVDADLIEVCLSQEEVKNAPDINTDAPVSRRHEINIMDYYAYGYYWAGGLWGTGLDPMALRTTLDAPEEKIPPKQEGDPNLRSVNEIIGYQIDTKDDETGAVNEAYVNARDWRITYWVVKTGGWFSGKEVLLAADWITDITWTDQAISTDLTSKQIESAPEFEPPLDEEYEQALATHYDRDQPTLRYQA
tara:strand:+ start:947 stop:1705 length:759 start_codon:yes stop_codon:yes gene_type:complete